MDRMTLDCWPCKWFQKAKQRLVAWGGMLCCPGKLHGGCKHIRLTQLLRESSRSI